VTTGTTVAKVTDQLPGAYSCIGPLRVFIELVRGHSVENRSPGLARPWCVNMLDAGLRSAALGQVEMVGSAVAVFASDSVA